MESATWDDLGGDDVRDRHTEMLEFTGYVGRDRELTKVARVLRKEPTPVHAVHSACRWVHDHLTYQPGSTGVHTSALEAWEAGKGVCQDYVHLTLLCCARRESRRGTSRATCSRRRTSRSGRR